MWISPPLTRPSTMASRGPSSLTLSSSQAAKETIDSAITKRIFAPESPHSADRSALPEQAKEAALFHFNYRNESPILAIKKCAQCTLRHPVQGIQQWTLQNIESMGRAISRAVFVL